MAERTLCVGYDLGDVYTQISVYDEKTYEPVCIGESEDENKRSIPSVLGIRDTGEWLCGLEALEAHKVGRCTLVDDLIEKIAEGTTIFLHEKEVSPVLLLGTFFKKTLSLIRGQYPDQAILQLVVTIRNKSRRMEECIKQALDSLGIGLDRAYIQSYKQSYMLYILNQNKEIWLNDVGLFDFTKRGLYYYQMTTSRQRSPYIIGMIEKDYSERLSYNMVCDDEQAEKAVYAFENIVQNAIHKQILSSLYMIGDGYANGWADESMRQLCVGRRVFKGQNLYVSGACYAARKRAGYSKVEDYIYIDEDMIPVHISTAIYVNAAQQDVILAKAGTLWYEVDHTIAMIPDDENEIAIRVTNVVTREVAHHIVSLDFIRVRRANRMMRISIRVRFQSLERCIITVKDEGFGDLEPTTHMIQEKIIHV